MSKSNTFTFGRQRGIIWVCDIVGSSKAINDQKMAGKIEEFIPRLYWMAIMFSEITGGIFVKWTGDGFMIWYPLPLLRNLTSVSEKIITGIFHFSAIVNVTQLSLERGNKITVRHGLSLEHDGLTMNIKSNGNNNFDIIGRSIVHAFRISGITCDFPNLAISKEIYDSYIKCDAHKVNFKKYKPGASDINRLFKGEKYLTNAIYVSEKSASRNKTKNGSIRSAKKVLKTIDSGSGKNKFNSGFNTDLLIDRMLAGPEWARQTLILHSKWTVVELIGSLRKIVKSHDQKKA